MGGMTGVFQMPFGVCRACHQSSPVPESLLGVVLLHADVKVTVKAIVQATGLTTEEIQSLT